MDTILKYLENTTIRNLAIVLIGAVIIFIIASIIKHLIPSYVKDTNNRYRTRKFIGYLSYFVLIILAMTIYSSQLSGLTVIIGVAGAGIAFALQEVIVSIAGFLTINFSNIYKVGDRVMLGGIKGDIVDISILRTSVMQVGDWVNGDLYNGKIVQISNSFVFKDPVFNYSGDFPFLWDELTIPLQSDCDYKYAINTFEEILNTINGEYAKGAQKHWDKMTKKYLIENAQVKPMVTMSFNESHMTFTLRYVVDYKKRRSTKHDIFTKAMDAINTSNGKIEIAGASMEVTQIKG